MPVLKLLHEYNNRIVVIVDTIREIRINMQPFPVSPFGNKLPVPLKFLPVDMMDFGDCGIHKHS